MSEAQEFRLRVEGLQRLNEQLQEKLVMSENSQEEAQRVASDLRRRVLDLETQLANLSPRGAEDRETAASYLDQANTAIRETQQVMKAAESSTSDEVGMLREQLTACCNVMAEQAAELSRLATWRHDRSMVVGEINELRSQLEKAQQETERTALQAHIERAKMQKEAREERMQAVAAAVTDALSRNGLDTLEAGRELKKHNEALTSRLDQLAILHQRESTQRANVTLKASESQELASLQAQLAFAASRSAAMKQRSIVQLTQRVRELESALQAERNQRQRDSTESQAKIRSAVQELELENITLRRIISVKAKEVEIIRALGKRILQQRSDVEAYLAQALEKVRTAITETSTQKQHHQAYDPSGLRQSVTGEPLSIADATRAAVGGWPISHPRPSKEIREMTLQEMQAVLEKCSVLIQTSQHVYLRILR